MKLGKQAPRHDERTLRLACYLNLSALPAPPAATDRAKTKNVELGMFGNDRIGDCVIAGRANLRRFFAADSGKPGPPVTDDDVIATYSRLSGYDPATGAGDTGLVELDALNDWRKVPFASETIDAYTAVDINNDDLVRAAIWVFDGLYAGYNLPQSALEQIRAGDPLTVVDSPIAGGHCMVELDYDTDHVWLATWGRLVPATWEWVHTYRDEGYAVIASLDQCGTDGRTAEGLDLEQMQVDLAAVT